MKKIVAQAEYLKRIHKLPSRKEIRKHVEHNRKRPSSKIHKKRDREGTHLDIEGWEERVDFLEGGLADGKDYNDFDLDALNKGTLIEMEHTDDLLVAREIAMDHLSEDPNYYDDFDVDEELTDRNCMVCGGKLIEDENTGWKLCPECEEI